MNPRLHLTMHEVVATQLWEDSPPEVWETACRLLEAGYARHEVLHMLSRPVSEQIWAALHEDGRKRARRQAREARRRNRRPR